MIKKKGSFKMGVGISSLLLIFVVLCLTTFAVLSYLTANADHKLTDKTGDTVSAYYAADGAAQQKLADIDDALKERAEAALQIVKSQPAGAADPAFLQFATRQPFGVSDPALLSGKEREIAEVLAESSGNQAAKIYQILVTAWAGEQGLTFSPEEMTLSFTVEETSSETEEKARTLFVTLRVNEDPAAHSRYEIIRHTIEQPGGDSEDEPLNLWPGN